MSSVSKVTIRLAYEGKGPEKDDIISIYEAEEYEEMFRIVYTASGSKKSSQFYLTRSKTVDYVDDTLISLEYDTESCDWVQVDTVIHPSVLYHVSDVGVSSTRHHILNSVETAMRANVERIRK
jgi:hypothetical protein